MSPKPTRRENPLKPKRSFVAYIKFMLAAVLLLILVDHFMWGDERPYVAKIRKDYYAEQELQLAEKEAQEKQLEGAINDLLPPPVEFKELNAKPLEATIKEIVPEDGEDYFEAPENTQENVDEPETHPETIPQSKIIPLPTKPPFRGKPKIAIVIDDLGMNLKESRIAMDLAPQVTLALLPYANKINDMAHIARSKGHELIIHTPMEAINADVSLGGMGLTENMAPEDFESQFSRIADSFEGYVGINNHMGSRLTQDPKAMAHLMKMLKQRGLFFLDSKTIATSVAADEARDGGVPYAVRDVFLDHQETPEFVKNALAQVERVAKAHGSAIAIGHPKDNTMKALQKWLPTLKDKGFELVPLSQLLIQPESMVAQADIEEVKPSLSWAPSTPLNLNPMSKEEPATLAVEAVAKQEVAKQEVEETQFIEPPAQAITAEQTSDLTTNAVAAAAAVDTASIKPVAPIKAPEPDIIEAALPSPANTQAPATQAPTPITPIAVTQPEVVEEASLVDQNSAIEQSSIEPAAGVEEAETESVTEAEEEEEPVRTYNPNMSDAGILYPGQEILHPMLLE